MLDFVCWCVGAVWLLRVPVGGTDGHVGGCVVLVSIPDGADGPV